MRMEVANTGLLIGQVPEQRFVGSEKLVAFPEVLVPSYRTQEEDVNVVVESIKHNKDWIEDVLHKSGAILFRGFGLKTAADFNSFVEAFDYPELLYIGGAAPRTNVVGRVFTSNESPPDQKIPFHHEMAQVPEHPAKVFFFCEVEPAQDGETPIVLSHLVYERMSQEWPLFVQQLEEKGLIYNRVLGEGDDLQSPIGRGWQSTFLTKDKSEAEER